MLIPAIKKLLSMAFPLMSMRLVQTCNTFIMMAILAQLGHTVLAASMTIGMSRLVLMLIFMAPLFATGIIAGRLFSQRNQHGSLLTLIQQGRILALLLSIPAIIVFALIKPILLTLHQPPTIVPYVCDYFKYFLFAMPAVYLVAINQQFLAGIQKQKLSLLLSCLSIVLSSFLNLGLVLGKFGFPKLGVAGAGITGVISNWSMLLLSMLFVRRALAGKVAAAKTAFFYWGKQILQIGTPISIKISSEMLMLFVLMIMVGWLGKTSMAANQISNQYMDFVLVPIIGLGEACAIVVSHIVGAEEQHQLRYLGHAAVICTTGFTLFVALVFLVFHRLLADIFIHFNLPNAMAIYHLAMWLLLIRILNMFFFGIATVKLWLLRGLYDTQFPMWVSMGTTWLILIPLAFAFGFWLHWGVIGITFAGVIGGLVATWILIKRWQWQLSNY